MITIESRVQDVVLDRLISTINATPAMIQGITQTAILPALETYTAQQLVPYPPPIRPGVFKRFATPRQRAYVMAKIRRGEWTGRTGTLGRQWRVTTANLPNGAGIRLANISTIAKYVVGDRQQSFHADTGWPVVRQHAPDVLRLTRDTFVEAYFDAVNNQMKGR